MQCLVGSARSSDLVGARCPTADGYLGNRDVTIKCFFLANKGSWPWIMGARKLTTSHGQRHTSKAQLAIAGFTMRHPRWPDLAVSESDSCHGKPARVNPCLFWVIYISQRNLDT